MWWLLHYKNDVGGGPCESDVAVLTTWHLNNLWNKLLKKLALLVYKISRGCYVFKMILWRHSGKGK